VRGWIGGDFIRWRVCVVVVADGFQGEAQCAVVGRGRDVYRVADYVVELGVFCIIFSISIAMRGSWYLRKGSMRLPGV
jgi:hypothetical protein